MSQEAGQCVVAVLPDDSIRHYGCLGRSCCGGAYAAREVAGSLGRTRRCVVGVRFSGQGDGRGPRHSRVGRGTEGFELGGMQHTACSICKGDKASMVEISRLLLLHFLEAEVDIEVRG